MEVTFNINRRCSGDTNLKQIGVHANAFASARGDRSKSIEHSHSGLIAFAGFVVAEYPGTTNLTIVGIGMNRNMQISPEGIGGSTTIGHGIILTNHNFNTTSHKCLTACLGNLAALNSLGSITIGVVVLRLIRRGQIYFLSHI